MHFAEKAINNVSLVSGKARDFIDAYCRGMALDEQMFFVKKLNWIWETKIQIDIAKTQKKNNSQNNQE